jgi:hypothetical protein
MQRKIEKILDTYGVSVTRKGEEATYRGFFQPVRSKSWQYLEGNYSPLGEVPRGQYVYIGPAGQVIDVGETLEVGGKEYMVRRVEPVYYGEEIAYFWGMCVEKGGEDTWGQS